MFIIGCGGGQVIGPLRAIGTVNPLTCRSATKLAVFQCRWEPTAKSPLADLGVSSGIGCSSHPKGVKVIVARASSAFDSAVLLKDPEVVGSIEATVNFFFTSERSRSIYLFSSPFPLQPSGLSSIGVPY